MNIVQESLGSFLALVEKLLSSRPVRRPLLAADQHQRSLVIRVTVIGVLFSIAMADPSAVDDEISRLKAGINTMVLGD
jgi:hypothetical protein